MIGKTILVLFAVGSIAYSFISERRNYGFVWSVWKRFRFKMFFEVIGVISLVFATAIMLWDVSILKWGWMSLFYNHGGNILITPIRDGSQSTSLIIRLMVPVFFFLFLLVAAFFARSEEVSFRKGYNEWIPIFKQSIKFGLVHCLVGIPLAAGIALIIPGFFFGYKYKRAFDYKNAGGDCREESEDEAVMVSTTYHTMYNMILVLFVLYVAVSAV